MSFNTLQFAVFFYLRDVKKTLKIDWMWDFDKFDKDNELAITAKEAAREFKGSYYINYTLDDYQINSASRIIENLKGKNVTIVIVVLPLSQPSREALGQNDLKKFIKTVYLLSDMHHIPVLDYISAYSGKEYIYISDVSHLNDVSGKLFSKKLATDLYHLLGDSICTP